ncbi:hypothetical protein EG329_001032 [Mollisiaceae sp. DMI_Dod_QoI]|nr:hypothetical protein EG329_001032 [Helotiales sp. DMI_Dod_QoI]
MSGLEAVGVVLAIFPGIDSVLSARSFVESFLGSAREYRRERFSTGVQLLCFILIFDADTVQDFHRNINYWSNEELKSWKESYIAGCNAIAVAAAIFASIGLTALQLPSLSEIHWTARAIFSASMVFGILSVLSATSAHGTIGLLNDPLALRLWLSRGQPSPNTKYSNPYSDLPLESSVSAVLVTKLPKALLNLAVFSYLIAFGLYLILSWAEAVPTGNHDYRNVFITFILCVGLTFVYSSICFVMRILGAATASHQFQYKRLGVTLEKSPELEALESKLQSFQRKSNLAEDIEALTSEMRAIRDDFNISRPIASTDFRPAVASSSNAPEEEKGLGSHHLKSSVAEDARELTQELRALREALSTFRSMGKSTV